MREKSCNPFSTFWRGFKSNFKQGTLCLLALAALGAVLWLELSWCDQFDGAMALLRYPLMAIGVAAVVLGCYVFPVMAAFQVSFKQLLMDSVYFAVKRPVATVAVLAANIAPMAVTYLDRGNLPTYAFLWVLCGFALVTLFNASLLLKSFAPYLEQQDEEEPPSGGPRPDGAGDFGGYEKAGNVTGGVPYDRGVSVQAGRPLR
ncbi:MAG: DUF624 domain-containing protein [Clostridiales bacterium]|nr:DUF624 domain-containing protein [Clostridiales bacterium]